MSREWFRGLAEANIASQAKEAIRSPFSTMRKPGAAFKSSGLITTYQARLGGIASVLFIFSFLVLTYTYKSLNPTVLMSALVHQDVIVCESSPSNISSSQQTPKVSILLGVMITIPKVERRNLLRVAYGIQTSEHADFTLLFVVGKPRNDDERTMIGLEALRYGDILFLDCEENMNAGKSFMFFSTVAAVGIQYDYVMKLDDDSYVRMHNLGKSLFELPRTDLYYGNVLPCINQNAYSNYMAGMGYVISWDLVQWVSKSPIPRNLTVGTEDRLMGDWLDAGNKGKNRVSKKPFFYDHVEFGGKCAHDLIPETILVHQVKTPRRWNQVLNYFERHRITTKPAAVLRPLQART